MEEQEKILDCIQKHSDINIVCIMEEDQELQEKINEKVKLQTIHLIAFNYYRLFHGRLPSFFKPPKEIEKESALETTKKAEEKVKEIENIEKIEKTQNW